MIRESNLAELDTIVQFKLNMFEEAGFKDLLCDHASEVIKREYLTMHEQEKIKHYVLELNGEIIGCAGAFIKEDLPFCFYKTPYYGFIGDVYVKKGHRRKGDARILTQASINWLTNKEIEMIRLLATAEAEGLYRKLGFMKTDEMVLWTNKLN